MKFYCIHEKADRSYDLLKKACEERSIEFFGIDCDKFDFLANSNIEKGDILYRVGTSTRAKNIERKLFKDGVLSFHKQKEGPRSTIDPISTYEANNLPTPNTINLMTRDREILKSYVEHLGGFPIIIKALGGSHGVGVMKIDSFSSFYSIVDYLLTTQKKEKFVLKRFIDVKKSARLIVLGDKVIDSIEYAAPEGDFRTNVGEKPNVTEKVFPKEVQDTAVKAVGLKGYEFGGVDILIDNDGKHYLAEANFPCFFPRCQMLTGKDIAGMMIDYLIGKAK